VVSRREASEYSLNQAVRENYSHTKKEGRNTSGIKNLHLLLFHQKI
jgi:hypothetical protein